jgi:hypothetical protein
LKDLTQSKIISGISLLLFLDQENYMLEKLSKNAGTKIVVHDHPCLHCQMNMELTCSQTLPALLRFKWLITRKTYYHICDF